MHDRYNSLSDAELVERARQDDREAFSALLERHYASVGRLWPSRSHSRVRSNYRPFKILLDNLRVG